MKRIALVLLVLAACEDRSPPSPRPAEAVADRWFAEPDQVSAALASAQKKVDEELRGARLVRLSAHGVDEEGKLHPRFGAFEVEFQREYDPDLPIGAPRWAHEEQTCLVLMRDSKGWTAHRLCTPAAATDPPRCTARTVWKRARKDGASAGAIAALTFERGRWHVTIDDARAPFDHEYDDGCLPENTAEAGGVDHTVLEEIDVPITAGPPGSIDDPICAELIRRTRCLYEKMGGSAEDAKRALDQAIEGWRQTLADDTTRQATIDGCRLGLDSAKQTFDSMGC